MHIYHFMQYMVNLVWFGPSWLDFDISQELQAAYFGNPGYTSHKAFCIALGPKDGATCHKSSFPN